MKKVLFIILISCFSLTIISCSDEKEESTETVTTTTNDWGLIFNKSNEEDNGSTGKMNYGNDTYNVVKIGTQWWMAENLKTAIYNDLTDIPNVTDDTWGNLITGAWSYYNNTTSNGNTYGKLYN